MASRIRARLLKKMSLAIIPLAALAILSLYNQRSIYKATVRVNAVSRESTLVSNLQQALDRAIMPSNDYIITGKGGYAVEFRKYSEEMERLLKEAGSIHDAFDGSDETVVEEKRILKGLKESWGNVRDISARIFSIQKPVGNRDAAELMEDMDYKWGANAIALLDRWHRIDERERAEALRNAEAAWRNAWVIIGGGVAATALLTMFLAYYYSGVFVTPIERLREHSLKIASGDFASKAGLRTNDELEDLSESMDRMSSELSALYRDLERKVEERTRELNHAYSEMKENEERYRALFNGTNDAIFVHPVPGGGGPMKFIDVNEVACSRLGYSRKELLELSPELIDAPGHEAGREAAIREIAQNGHAIFEMAHVAKDGRVIPVEISSRVFVLKGAQQGLSIVRDISERKMVEEKALRERRLNESIVNYMPAGVAFLDNGFILRKFNALYAGMIRKYTPYTPDEALGMCYFDYVPGSREQVEGWFKEVRDSGESADRKGFELKIGAGEDEKATYWDTAVTPVFDEAGKVEGILILTQDITERKRSEDSLKERVEELEMFRKLTLKRELRLRELKDRIEALEMELKGARA